MTNYTDVPKASEQLKICALQHFLSEVLSSANRILRATDLKKIKHSSCYSKNTIFFIGSKCIVTPQSTYPY